MKRPDIRFSTDFHPIFAFDPIFDARLISDVHSIFGGHPIDAHPISGIHSMFIRYLVFIQGLSDAHPVSDVHLMFLHQVFILCLSGIQYSSKVYPMLI